jgi:acyl carrier protein
MTDNEIIAKLRETMRKSSTVQSVRWDGVTSDTVIRDIGFDSLAILDLVYDIQQDFGLEFQPEELAKLRTVGELAGFLRSKGA